MSKSALECFIVPKSVSIPSERLTVLESLLLSLVSLTLKEFIVVLVYCSSGVFFSFADF